MRRKLLSWAGLFIVLIAGQADAVHYTVTFEALWSQSTHPNAYVSSAHYSPLIGTTHNDTVSFWTPGGTATQGIENVAETGSVSAFITELNSAIDAGTATAVIRGSNFRSPGSHVQTFETSPDFPYLTLASMIAPSPDWFVGISGMDLRDDNGEWIDEFVVPLYPWDAGTEEGNALSLTNPSTSPWQPIRRLDTDESSLLFESELFGNFRIQRTEPCDLNLDGLCDLQDLSTADGLYSAGDLEIGVDVVLGENTRFDVNEDGRIDGADLDAWLGLAAEHNGFAEPYLRGDTNLNDHVGFGDFTGLSANFGTGREWSEGNYRGSGVTSFADFLSLSRNFGEAIARQPANVQAVPEPSSGILAIAGLGLIAARTRRFRRDR